MATVVHPFGAADPDVGPLLERCHFPAAETEVVCAVSGGADSLSLLVLARAAELRVTAVHVDHGIRGGSEDEAEVVAAAAARFGAAFRSERVVVEDGPNLEARAREARLAVLGVEALTGHTADDQAETVLLRLLRGSGVRGLAAMSPGPRHPILALRRAETEALCAAVGLEPVSDPSNTDPRFTRNRIRHEVLPLLAEIVNHDPVPNLVRAATNAREAEATLNHLAGQLDPTDTKALRQAPPGLAAVALRVWLTGHDGHPPTRAELHRVLAVARHEVAACELVNGRRVARTGGRLRIECADT